VHRRRDHDSNQRIGDYHRYHGQQQPVAVREIGEKGFHNALTVKDTDSLPEKFPTPGEGLAR